MVGNDSVIRGGQGVAKSCDSVYRKGKKRWALGCVNSHLRPESARTRDHKTVLTLLSITPASSVWGSVTDSIVRLNSPVCLCKRRRKA